MWSRYKNDCPVRLFARRGVKYAAFVQTYGRPTDLRGVQFL